MLVLFISRSTIFSVPGGDTVQMECTAHELRKMGVEVTIWDNQAELEYDSYDLIHFFNLTRPAAILFHTSKSSIPYVVSTIYVQYDFYKTLYPRSLMGLATRILGIDGIEYLKTAVKHFLGKDKLDYLPFLFKGQKKSIQEVLSGASAILPNSKSEALRVFKNYRIITKEFIVPNGIDFEKFDHDLDLERVSNQLICVGQIEPRKNQLNLIKAIDNLDVTLLIVGDSAPNHTSYLETCKAAASDKVQFIPRISQEELVYYYLSSAIHILPSWFETTGLSSLEAAYLGCKLIVSPNGDTRDYFGEFANYCDPSSVTSIQRSIETSLGAHYQNEVRELIKKEFNWLSTAKKTKQCYESIKIKE